MPLNERSAPTIRISCGCNGHNAGCVNCYGTGEVTKRACQRCGGTGSTGGKCLDCQGSGWRELDNPHPEQP